MKKVWIFGICLSLLLTACGDRPSIRFALGYIPNIQFAPVYMAIEKGYFSAEGLELELAHMDENQAAALVGAGDLQFAVVSGEQVLLARAQGLPVVYVAAWYQDYPVSVVALAEEGLTSLAGLRGQTIGLPMLSGANYIGLRALLHAGGLAETDVTLDSIGYTQVESLAAGRDPVVCVYTANEPNRLRALGYDITELRVSDYADLAANGLLTNEKTIAEDPELVRRMVRAFLKGLNDAIADPQAAYQVSMIHVEGLAAGDAVQQQVLATSIELWRADRLGYSDPQSWENMQSVLLDMGLLDAPLDLTQAFTNQFIP
jgi:NitT/TauT family transport system substrate-binding protein